MDEESNVDLDTQNQEAEEAVNTEEVKEETPVEDSEDLDALKEKNKKLFERAKKAEAEAKELKKAPKPEAPKESPVSFKDQLALINAKVHEDDLETVLDYAKYKGITISEALKSPVVQGEIREKSEQRKTAEVSNTSGSKRVSNKLTDEALLQRALEGDVPEDDAGIQRLAEARINAQKKK